MYSGFERKHLFWIAVVALLGLLLAYRVVEDAADRAAEKRELGDGPHLYLLHFAGPVDDEARDKIRALGATFIFPHPPAGYTVWMTPEQAEASERYLFVRSAEPRPLADRIEPTLAARAQAAGAGDASEEVLIIIYDDGREEGTVAKTIAALEALGGERLRGPQRFSATAPVLSVIFRMPVVALEEAARLDAVLVVDYPERPAIEE